MASARFVAVVVLAAVAVASAASAPAFGANETPLSQVLPARGLTLRLNGDVLAAGKSASLTWAATLSPLLSAMGRPRVTAEARELAWVEAGDRTDVTGAFCEAVLRWNGDLSSWTVLQANVSSIMIDELMAKPARVATNADKNAVSASFMSFNIRNGARLTLCPSLYSPHFQAWPTMATTAGPTALISSTPSSRITSPASLAFRRRTSSSSRICVRTRDAHRFSFLTSCCS